MSDITVQTDFLAGSASSIGSVQSQLAGTLSSLQAASSVLTNQWEGEAKQAYNSKYSTWSNEIQHLSAILDAAARAAADISEIYRAADEHVGKTWSL